MAIKSLIQKKKARRMISVLIDLKLDKYSREIKYSFGYIFETLGLSHRFITDPAHLRQNDILIIYGLLEPITSELNTLAQQFVTIFIQADAKLYEPAGYTPEQLRRIIRDIKLFSQTPVISEKRFEYPAENYIEKNICAAKINFDLVGNVFYHLGVREELADRQRAPEVCFADSSSAFQNWREIPFTDNFLWLLDNLLKEQVKVKKQYIVQKHYWPHAQEMAIALTHSVDDLQKWDWNSIILGIVDDLLLLFRFRWRTLINNLFSKLKYIFTNYEIYWNFQEYLALEKENKVHSTWFIAAEASGDIDYSIDDADLQDEIRSIQKHGGEIGLLTSDDKLGRDEYLARKKIMLRQLQKEQLGIRQQFFRQPNITQDLQQKLCPLYNCSSAFQENPGFKHGMAFPYHRWVSGIKSNHYDLPVAFRDILLKIRKFQLVKVEDAKLMLKKIMQTARRHKGIFCLDFTVANFTDIPYCNKLYSYALALFRAEKAWMATCGEIADWWIKRCNVTIDESEFEISVLFPDKLESFVIQITGEVKVANISGAAAKVERSSIFFSGLEAGTVAVIQLQKGNQAIETE